MQHVKYTYLMDSPLLDPIDKFDILALFISLPLAFLLMKVMFSVTRWLLHGCWRRMSPRYWKLAFL